jgi:hypothetical protein
MLPTDDVVDMMWRKLIIFMEQAVLATPSRPTGDEQTYRGGNPLAHDFGYC